MVNETIDDLRALIKGLGDENILMDKVDTEDDLMSMGLNSILFVRLVVAIEAKYGFEFDDEDIDYDIFKSINDFADYIENKKL